MCSLLHLNRGEGILHSAPKRKLFTQTIKLNAEYITIPCSLVICTCMHLLCMYMLVHMYAFRIGSHTPHVYVHQVKVGLPGLHQDKIVHPEKGISEIFHRGSEL